MIIIILFKNLKGVSRTIFLKDSACLSWKAKILKAETLWCHIELAMNMERQCTTDISPPIIILICHNQLVGPLFLFSRAVQHHTTLLLLMQLMQNSNLY